MSNLPNLVSVHWLKEHLFDDDLILLDASMNKSVHGNNSTELVKIPTARLFDFETVFVDKQSALSNMMPSESVFHCLGYSNLSVFDGSWSEWGANKKFPVATSDLN